MKFNKLKNKEIKLDLFKLHDPANDKTLRKCIVVKGKNLKFFLNNLIEQLEIKGLFNIDLIKYLIQKLNISIASAERLVYLKRDWFPLIFIKELLNLLNKKEFRFEIQKEIEFIKVNQPPIKILKVSKRLTKNLCKIIGAHAADGTVHGSYFCITDRYKENILAFNKWLKEEFDLNSKLNKVSQNEWRIFFRNKVFTRYLTKIFGFPSGCKQYTVKEPEIIKNSQLGFRKAFALGAMTFEAGIGMKHQIAWCVSSRDFRDSISEILSLHNIKHTSMKRPSLTYWKFWSNKLTKEEALKWMEFFEPNTEKWFKLKDYINGFSKQVGSFEEAVEILNTIYPKQSSSKIILKDVLLALKELEETYRYELSDYLIKKKNLKSYGGRWAHSLRYYLDILKNANIISVKKKRFGKKKSFGTIIREVYIFNENIKNWRVPDRIKYY